MVRRSFAGFALSLLLLGSAAVAQDAAKKEAEGNQETPSLEAMLAEASKEAAKSEQVARDRVKKAVKVFGDAAIDPERTFARERDAMISMGSPIVPPLLDAFGAETRAPILDQLQQTLVALLGQSNDSTSTARLVGWVKGQNAEVARAAAAVLGGIKAETAAPDLRAAFKASTNPQVRSAILKALSDIGDPAAVELFIAGLSDGAKEVRVVAVNSLAALGRKEDVKIVLPLLSDPETTVALATLTAIGNYRESSEVVLKLHEALKFNDENVVLAALEAIRKINKLGLSKANLHDVATSKDASPAVKNRVARILLDMGDPFGLDKLADPLLADVNRNQKDFDPRFRLGKLYYDFGAWKKAADHFEKAPTPKQTVDQIKLNDMLARCYSRLKNFGKAADCIQRSGRGNDWKELKSDPDFAEMSQDRRWAKYFDGN